MNYLDDSSPLFGLVLAGGKSSRMGEDKATMNYHGQPQAEYQADLLESFCVQTFISYGDDSQLPALSKHKPIMDTYTELGPLGGMLSAFTAFPDKAWLIAACDLPYLTRTTIEQLVAGRDADKLASCFYNSTTELLEPLITIWEPRAYPVLLKALHQGYASPRKVLSSNDVAVIAMKDSITLTNVNDKAAYEMWKNSIKLADNSGK